MHKSFYIIWTVLLLLIGSITLGYFINKTLNPSRAFSVGLTANTAAIPTIVEEEPAFTMEEEVPKWYDATD
ncbi:hypothetical protein ABEW34_26535 [Paenibacillus algorifonticola]|uniref:hypothetical protein n=1 Tax=Paenibacillus algorifonticola TaxID=684063 RepID=UPI003D28B709